MALISFISNFHSALVGTNQPHRDPYKSLSFFIDLAKCWKTPTIRSTISSSGFASIFRLMIPTAVRLRFSIADAAPCHQISSRSSMHSDGMRVIEQTVSMMTSKNPVADGSRWMDEPVTFHAFNSELQNRCKSCGVIFSSDK